MTAKTLRTPLLALLAALASLAAVLPASAGATVSWVVHGRGFGHGVGMSAYGAYGYAQHGKGYPLHPRPLLHGHHARDALQAAHVVRVLLDTSSGDVDFSGATSACGQTLEPQRSYQAHRVGAAVRLLGPGGKPLANCGGRLRAAGSRGRIDDRRPRHLPRRAGDRAHRRLPQRRQRARPSTSTSKA